MVFRLLDAFQHRVVHDGFLPEGHQILSRGKAAAEERVTLFALLALAREHVAALPLTTSGDGLYLSAASRSLALLANASQPRISRRLRQISGQGSARSDGHRTLVALERQGTRGDASTYVLRPDGQIITCSQVSSLQERSMNKVAVVRPVNAPDMDVLRHDAFATDIPSDFPTRPRRRGLGFEAALIMATLAANPGGLDVTTLSAVTGSTDETMEAAVSNLLAIGRSDHEMGPVLIDKEGEQVVMAAMQPDTLLEALDVWAQATGLAGISRARHLQIDRERRTFHPPTAKAGKPARAGEVKVETVVSGRTQISGVA
ncbi:hypothetical protein [Blastococcus capsensis]|uniref:hypothetical protein n=1 Tax=Blastococcus capsensis TaxID=1564163 RepID=UPI002542579D|nr:hypothetical protein [Blastococcus capsensis]MDK3258927.1 hypothetical protein [Blastococcus capsensis]